MGKTTRTQCEKTATPQAQDIFDIEGIIWENADPSGDTANPDQQDLRGVLDSLELGAYVIDMETFKILYINTFGRRIFGDVEGKTCWRVLQDGHHGPCPSCNNRQSVDIWQKPARTQPRQFKNTRDSRWYECRDSVISWLDGRMVRLEIATDITEQKRQAGEHSQAMKQEALHVLMKGTVADLNDILAVGVGHLSLARLHTTPLDPAAEHLEKAEEALMKAGKLCARLLAYIGEERPAFQESVLDSLLLESVNDLLGDCGPRANFVMADPLWHVWIDESQIRQVIFHLLQNARQAMPNEGGKITIRAENVLLNAGEIGNLPAGPYVCWSVEDQGDVISEDRLAGIFDPPTIYQPENNTETSGLGLAACRTILEKNQAHIECLSKPGTGTVFTIHLPAVMGS